MAPRVFLGPLPRPAIANDEAAPAPPLQSSPSSGSTRKASAALPPAFERTGPTRQSGPWPRQVYISPRQALPLAEVPRSPAPTGAASIGEVVSANVGTVLVGNRPVTAASIEALRSPGVQIDTANGSLPMPGLLRELVMGALASSTMSLQPVNGKGRPGQHFFARETFGAGPWEGYVMNASFERAHGAPGERYDLWRVSVQTAALAARGEPSKESWIWEAPEALPPNVSPVLQPLVRGKVATAPHATLLHGQAKENQVTWLVAAMNAVPRQTGCTNIAYARQLFQFDLRLDVATLASGSGADKNKIAADSQIKLLVSRRARATSSLRAGTRS